MGFSRKTYYLETVTVDLAASVNPDVTDFPPCDQFLASKID